MHTDSCCKLEHPENELRPMLRAELATAAYLTLRYAYGKAADKLMSHMYYGTVTFLTLRHPANAFLSSRDKSLPKDTLVSSEFSAKDQLFICCTESENLTDFSRSL